MRVGALGIGQSLCRRHGGRGSRANDGLHLSIVELQEQLLYDQICVRQGSVCTR